MKIFLWILQILLAALFLFSGIMKFQLPAEVLTKGSPFSASFLRFIGICEIVGGIGLIVPAATRVMPSLTPLAAACLGVIMVGATITTIATMSVKFAILPFVVLILSAVIAYGRWRLSPIPARSGLISG